MTHTGLSAVGAAASGMPIDTPTWRVYTAEQSIDPGTWLSGIEAARTLLRRVTRSRWFRDRYPHAPRITVRLTPDVVTPDGAIKSFAQGNSELQPTAFAIHLHPRMLSPLVLLHEVAHCIQPRLKGDIRMVRRGLLAFGARARHDDAFTAILTELVTEFGTGANHTDLASAYAHYEVPITSAEAIPGLVIQGLELEAHLKDLHARRASEVERVVPDRPRDWIPSPLWGFHLAWARRHPQGGGQPVSQAALASRISIIQPCTSRDIRAVERMEQLPIPLPQRRIAMGIAAALNMDPVWARTALGLARWDCGVSLEELRLVGPDWTTLVEHLNELLHKRPPRWDVPGER